MYTLSWGGLIHETTNRLAFNNSTVSITCTMVLYKIEINKIKYKEKNLNKLHDQVFILINNNNYNNSDNNTFL